MTAPAAERPLRLCDKCGALDDHPRHVISVGSGDNTPTPDFQRKVMDLVAGDADRMTLAVRELLDTSTTMKHMDCCRADGCPDGTCNIVTAGAGALRGDDLVAHLTSGEHDNVGAERTAALAQTTQEA